MTSTSPQIKILNLVDFLSSQPAPLEVGSFDIGSDGTVARRSEGQPIQFSFVHRGVLVAVTVEEVGGVRRVRLFGNLGLLPYSAESRERRAGALQVLQAAAQTLNGRFRVTSDQKILLTCEADLPSDLVLTPPNLLARVTAMLVAAKPYLDLLTLYVTPRG